MKSKFWGTQEDAIKAAKAAGNTIVRSKIAPVIFAFEQTESGKFLCRAWKGKAAKPSFYYSFRTMARMEEHCATFVTNVAHWNQRTAERKAANKVAAADFYMVGDVLVNTWGYEQTNVDYYQVTRITKSNVELRKISAKCSQTGYMQGMSQPDRNNFTGEPFMKKVQRDGWISFKHGGCSKWTGKANHWTAYH